MLYTLSVFALTIPSHIPPSLSVEPSPPMKSQIPSETLPKPSDRYTLSSPHFFHCVLCFIIVPFTVSHVHYIMTAQRILTSVYLYVCSKSQDYASPVTDAQKLLDILVSLFLQFPYLEGRSTIVLLSTYMEAVKTHEVTSEQYLILSFLWTCNPILAPSWIRFGSFKDEVS